jgi:hypothetical protein
MNIAEAMANTTRHLTEQVQAETFLLRLHTVAMIAAYEPPNLPKVINRVRRSFFALTCRDWP